MFDWLKAVPDLLKVSPRYCLAPMMGAAILLFSPENALERIGVADIAKHYRPVIGLVFVAFASLFGSGLIAHTWRQIVSVHQHRRRAHEIGERLRCLTEHEKQILRRYIDQQTRSQLLDFTDGVVNGLEASGIIQRAATVGSLDAFAYNIGDIAWQILNKDERLLR